MDSPHGAQGVASAIGAAENEFLERLLQIQMPQKAQLCSE